jgi:hypothetical protein
MPTSPGSIVLETPRFEAYVDEVANRVRDVVEKRLVGVWLVGSAALGDYDPRRSEVNVQAVATTRLSLSERSDLVARLGHEALANPARGLEFVLYAREDLAVEGGRDFRSTSTLARGWNTTRSTTPTRTLGSGSRSTSPSHASAGWRSSAHRPRRCSLSRRDR